jgi:hypothetical protein
MKKFFAIALLAFAFAATGFAQADRPEKTTVTGKDLSGLGPSSGIPGGIPGPRPGRAGLEQKKKPDGEGGSFNGGIRRGCQECQSDSALYTCGVYKLAPLDETWDQTKINLSSENCCAASGGRVLSTRLGSCGS